MESLKTLKAALDGGLITAEDFETAKGAFLRAQQIRSGFEAGLLSPADYVMVKEAFLSGVALPNGAQGSYVAQGSDAGSRGRGSASDLQQYANNSGPQYAAPPPQRQAPAPAAAPAPSRPVATAAPQPPPAAAAPRAAAPIAPPKATGIEPTRIASGGDTACVKGKSLSGIVVAQKCVEIYSAMKTKNNCRYLIYRIDDGGQMVVPDTSGPPTSNLADLAEALPENDCRYAVYDFKYVNADSCEFKKIIFVLWSPNTSKVKNKMMYASTKDFFKQQLDGVALELQATDPSEIDEEEMRLRVQATLTRK